VQLKATLVDGLANADLTSESFSRTKLTPCFSFSVRYKYWIYLGALTVIVVKVTPKLHPTGMSVLERMLNCLDMSKFPNSQDSYTHIVKILSHRFDLRRRRRLIPIFVGKCLRDACLNTVLLGQFHHLFVTKLVPTQCICVTT
jgi:hypothetical protein